MSYFYEQAQTPVQGSFADGVASLGKLATAARDAAWYANNTNAHDIALEEAYDRRNDAIFAATGQRLPNPHRQLFASAGGSRSARAHRDFAGDWQRTAAKLQDNRPELANVIRAHVPIMDDAIGLAREAGTRFDTAMASRPDFAGKWAAVLVGGFAGSLRDPIQLGTLMLGGGAGTARNTAVRVLEVAGKEAAINGSVELLMQPMVQAWREQAGLDHGFDQAMFNVLTAAGMGGVFGGALEGAGTAARAIAGEPAPSLRSLPPEIRGAWHAAEADAFLQSMRPGGMTPEQHDAHVAEALRFAEHQKEFGGVKPYTMAAQGDLQRPMNVVEFIASLGGLRDDSGELAARGLSIRTTMTRFGPFMRRKGETVEGGGLFNDGSSVRGKGLSADEVRQKLVEAGYLDDMGLRTGGEATTSENDIFDLIDAHISGETVIRSGDHGWQAEVDARKEKRRSDFELQRYGADAWIAETHGVAIADEALAMRDAGVTWHKDDLEWAADWHSRNPQETARVAIDEAIIQRMMKQNDEADALMGGKQLDASLATLPVDVDASGKVVTYGDFIEELDGNRRAVQGQGRGGDGPGREGPAAGQRQDGGSPRQAAGEGAAPTGLNETPPKPEGGVDDPRDAAVGQWVDDIIASEKILRDSEKAARPKNPPENIKGYRDTRNDGVRFHGSPSPVTAVDDFHYGSMNYYGNGFYTSDAFDVASGYARRRGAKEPTYYQVEEVGPVNAFDMEQPVPDWLVKDDPSDIVQMAMEEPPKNVRELYDNMREVSAGEGLSADEIQEIFDSFKERFMQEGFNAVDHRGGLRTKAPEHSVRIYFEPSKQVKITKVDPETFKAPKPDAPAAASSPAAAASADQVPPPDMGPLLSPFDDLPGERTLAELTEFADRPEHLSQLVEACKAV